MLRVHFTMDDLPAVRFSDTPAPLLELSAALATLQRGDESLVFGRWRRETRVRLPRSAAPLLALVPASGRGPLFLDPVSDGLADGIERVRSTPRALVRAELDRVCPREVPVTPLARRLADQDMSAWQALARALSAAHAAVLAADWPRVLASHRTDQAYRARRLAEVGLRGALTELHPGSSWLDSGTLAIPSTRDRDEYLTGAGLVATPSAFWTGDPLMADHPDGSAMLIYPALTPLPLVDPQPGGDPLAALLGRTRAAVLRALVDYRTTSELAAEIGVSLAAASQHAKTLRANGLITTERAGKAVLHSCTPLGLRLLAG